MDWREKVTTVSEILFPGLSQTHPNHYIVNEIVTNIPLQLTLYFNVVYFPIWLLVMVAYLITEYNCLRDLQKFILITVLITIIFNEILRLYLGYQGNLKDKISELAAFWFLSLLLQVPLEIIILINPYFNWKVVEVVSHSAMAIMLILEIITGYFALKNIASYQAAIFRIMKIKNLDKLE